MRKEQILGLIRHSLTFAGGVLIMKGIIDPTVYETISGALLTLIGSVWSVIENNKDGE